ncbi:hypothetical protein HQN87_19720 [Paenibacillus tritici]|uniref:Uncharacterized protein n=1 Tax=Paenibacillus tritici TaxID=1873425 RepID=A0ABX2DU77_9BACL|nr:hypothetical protein [Paenibacillus tritici]NQX47568.1 hypothetical protein [Paenibacillus tritici]
MFFGKNTSQILFLYFRISDYNLISAEYLWDHAMIRGFLQKKGIESTQYIQSQLPSIYELTEEIVFSGVQQLIIGVDQNNLWCSKLVTREIRRIDATIEILWLTASADIQEEEGIQIVALDYADCLGKIQAWISGSVRGSANNEKCDISVNPYSDGLIPSDKAITVGLRLSTGCPTEYSLERELVFLNTENLNGIIPVLDESQYMQDSLVDELCKLKVNLNLKYTFRVHVRSEQLDEAQLQRLVAAGIKDIVIEQDMETLNLKEMLKRYKAWEEIHNIRIRLKTFYPVSADIMDEWIEIEQGVQVHEQAIVNGYLSFVTGLYPPGFINGSVKHIGITESALYDLDYHKHLKEFVGLNYSFIIDNSDKFSKQPERVSEIHARDSIWRNNLSLFGEVKDLLGHSQNVLPHLILEEMSEDEFKYELNIDDFYRKEKLQIVKIPYASDSDLNIASYSCQYKVLLIDSSEDLSAFLRDVECLNQSGEINHSYQIPSLLAESCRWSGGNCKLCQMPRFHTDGSGQVKPCGGSSKGAGSVNEGYAAILQNVGAAAEEEQLIRQCNGCEVEAQCSKCTFLPDFMSREQYCATQKNHKSISRYISVTSVLQMLSRSSRLLSGVEASQIKISSNQSVHYYDGDVACYNSIHVPAQHFFLISIQKQPYLYDALKHKMLKVNEPLAVIFEAFLKGINEKELSDYLQTHYEINDVQAEMLVEEAVQSFVRLGCMPQSVINKKILVEGEHVAG